jgi:ATP-dependent Clp protease ATP-binding subunit ClpB
MQFDKFTMKSQEAVQAAQSLAASRGHQELQPAHLMQVLLEQTDGVVVPVLRKMGIDPALLRQEMENLLSQLPQVSGSGAGQLYASNRFKSLLDQAFKVAKEMQDETVLAKARAAAIWV